MLLCFICLFFLPLSAFCFIRLLLEWMFLFLLSFRNVNFLQFIVCVRIRAMLFFQATISICDSKIIKDLHFNKQNNREFTSAHIFGYCNELILIRDFKAQLMTFFFDAMI